MQRWTGGSRTKGEDRRQGVREGFFPPPQPKPFVPPVVSQLPPPPSTLQGVGLCLADTTNAVRDFTPKQLSPSEVQRSVDAQTLRWAVRSPVSCDRQRKKHRVEVAQPPPLSLLDVSPIAVPGDASEGDFSIDGGGTFLHPHVSYEQMHSHPPHDPHQMTLPFDASGADTSMPLFPSADYAPTFQLFNTGRDMLHFTPEQQQQWQQGGQMQQRATSRIHGGFPRHHGQHGAHPADPTALWGEDALPLMMQPQPSLPPQPAFHQQQPPVFRPQPYAPGAAVAGPLPSSRPWAQPPSMFQQQQQYPGDLMFTPFSSSYTTQDPFS